MDLETILKNLDELSTVDEIKERIAGVKADIAGWDLTLEQNLAKIADLALECMTLRTEIHASKADLLKLSRRLLEKKRPVIQ